MAGEAGDAPEFEGAGRRVAVVVSRFNDRVTSRLLDGALAALRERGVREGDIDVFRVSGAWELPGAARRVAVAGRHDAVVALGCVIRGETAHFEYVAGEAARGLARVAFDGPVPVGFGVLTTDSERQALARAGEGSRNKGREAALAALEMVEVYRRIDGGVQAP